MLMKKLTFFTFVGAIALLAVGCQREQVEVAPEQPVEEIKDGEVTTQFVLSIAPGTTPKTKLGADVVQVGYPFRGISKAHLLTFELDTDNQAGGEYYIFKPGDDKAVATRDYDLDNIVSQGEISDVQSSRVVELSLPLRTNALAFYALAAKPSQGSMTDIDYNNTYGKLAVEGTGFNSTVEDIKFSLVSRLTDGDAFRRFGNLMARIMTGFVKTECKQGSTEDRRYAYWWPQDATSKTWPTRIGDSEENGTLPADDTDRLAHEAAGYTYVVGNSSWAEMGAAYAINHNADPSDNVAQSPLAEVLGDAYYQLTTIQKDKLDPTKEELRSGSAASILKTCRDLNDVLGRVINAVPTSQDEQVAKETAKEIRFRMKAYFTSNDDWKTINWKTIGPLIEAAQARIPDYATAIAGTNFNQDYLPSNSTLTGGFPLNLGLPMSTALLYVVDDPVAGISFQYRDAVPAYGMDADPVPITDYRFPPEIVYWANSGIRVNDAVKSKTDYPNTVATWADNDDALWTGWSANASVLSTTRSVAMMKQVNYGIALLQTNVSYAGLDGTVAYDNNAAIHDGEADNAIVIDGNSFKVTGLFIGGVREKIGWDFIGITDPVNNKPNKIIYDRVSAAGVTIPAPGAVNPITFYTTTWDNYQPQLDNTGNAVGVGRQEDQSDVYVALELVNNTGKDIWGELNIIRAGGTFYLVGKLDLETALAGNTVTFPDSKFCHYPPFNTDGSTIQVKRVFMQDYMTTANLKFGKNSLKHAYVTVPDLRSSQISLGLSVDLKWNEGLTFDVAL